VIYQARVRGGDNIGASTERARELGLVVPLSDNFGVIGCEAAQIVVEMSRAFGVAAPPPAYRASFDMLFKSNHREP
jgi:hypothetical protein